MSSPTIIRVPLPEIVVPGKRLGRNYLRDSRSDAYMVREAATAPAPVEWPETIGPLDQGNVGSCTGNAFTHMLGTKLFAPALPSGTKLDQPFAVKRYSRATEVDSFRGTYPPTDTGSDGTSVCKAGQADGFDGAYTHATTLSGCYAMIPNGPFIIGVSWYEGMDSPDVHGNVEISGAIRGGHEVCVLGRDADGRWRVKNSWGPRWGLSGYFYLTDAQLSTLLAQGGDATQATPINVAPPTPAPTGTAITFTDVALQHMDLFARAPSNYANARQAAVDWKAARAL